VSRTLGDLRADLRDRLDETQARYWDDRQLNRWINEGALDMARRAECLPTSTTITAVSGTQSYALPTNLFRAHRATFSADLGVTVYPLEFRDRNELDEIWSTRPQTQQYAPAFAFFDGYGTNATIGLFPIPSAGGQLIVYYYRTPSTAVSDTDALDTPTGWEDLAIQYAEYVALRKDSNPDWQESKQMYEEHLAEMIDMTRRLHDQAGYITSRNSFQPFWLVGIDEY